MARHPVKMTDYYFEETFDDGEKFIVFFDTPEEMFYEAAKFYAFDDLDTGMKITKISCEGDLWGSLIRRDRNETKKDKEIPPALGNHSCMG